jgi:hypothetical protein
MGLLFGSLCAFAQEAAPALSFGADALALNGPWKFQLGDDRGWAEPAFDDSRWESLDLTPLPGAHDGDVGLTQFTPGWSAHGHPGASGFAWYRLTLRVADPHGAALWLAGPALVDNAYQIYLNGELIGGIGDFAQAPPVLKASQPRLFALPSRLWRAEDGALRSVIAIRVACPSPGLAPEGCGIHIAPVLGLEAGVRSHYRQQWLEKVEGYAVDATEPVFFLILAVLALCMIPFEPQDRFNVWLAAALTLLAAARFNQPLYWLAGFETLGDFVLWRLSIVEALLLGAWVMAWRAAFRLQARWQVVACVALTAAYILARLLGTTLLFPALPSALVHGCATLLKTIHLGFLVLLVVVVWQGERRGRGSWPLRLSILLGSIGLFASELGQLGVPGIWFPFGVGVSRTEYAYAAFDVALFSYLLQRLWGFAGALRLAAP